jgi:uncharacterized membrane protein YidH (DUF202 family)
MTGSSPNGEPAGQPDEPYGAAAERTAMAWQRTGLGVVVGSFLLFHSSFQLGFWPLGTVALALGLTVAVLAVFAFPTDRYLRGDPADSWTLLTVISLAVAALGLLGAVIAVATLLN